MKYGINATPDESIMDIIDTADLSAARNATPPCSAASITNGAPVMASPSSKLSCRPAESDAVVFSIQFYGKTVGEVGLMDQDLSELDWKKFKSYLVSIFFS